MRRRWTLAKNERWRDRIGSYAQRLSDMAQAAEAEGADDAAIELRRAALSVRDAESLLPRVGSDV